MNPVRLKQLYGDFTKALKRLREALDEDIDEGSIVIDGTIQRFEFTFELSWKLARLILGQEGIETDTPRSAVKEAFKAKIIRDGEGWIDMLEDRNKTSHIYDEKEALKIYRKIKEQHFRLLEEFKDTLKKSIDDAI